MSKSEPSGLSEEQETALTLALVKGQPGIPEDQLQADLDVARRWAADVLTGSATLQLVMDLELAIRVVDGELTFSPAK
jgi:hypothetical protein